MTIREVLAEGSVVLAAAGIESAQLDAALLLAEILNVNRSSLIAAAHQPLTQESRAAFNGLIKRRMDRECVAYILGRKEFYGLEFLVNPSVLVPRPDTEALVEAALAKLATMAAHNGPLRALDLCTGSGAIAIALGYAMPELRVWAADKSAGALKIAQANGERLLPPEQRIHFCCGDLYEALPSPSDLFSIIVSNPPYIPRAEIPGLAPEVRMEPIMALDGGADGLDLITTIIARAPEFLCSGGALLLEADPRQMHSIELLMRQAGFSDIQTIQDLSGSERVIAGTFS